MNREWINKDLKEIFSHTKYFCLGLLAALLSSAIVLWYFENCEFQSLKEDIEVSLKTSKKEAQQLNQKIILLVRKDGATEATLSTVERNLNILCQRLADFDRQLNVYYDEELQGSVNKWDEIWRCCEMTLMSFLGMGYGDKTPRTKPGKLCSFFNAFLGMLMLGYIVGVVTGVLISDTERKTALEHWGQGHWGQVYY